MLLLEIPWIGKTFTVLRKCFTIPYFGFVQGHYYLTKSELRNLRDLVGSRDAGVIKEFENRFSALIGDGRSVSFATGRMGFYSLMQALSIKPGDEIIIQGATCSVMVNAILRIGATPVYADIDPNTFGSSADAIETVLTPNTRLIVAQHSFGIPCEIAPIADLARNRGIFLLEDCALTVGSSINGVICGNFGDAALFSTDHSKPINTITGGLLYTRDSTLYQKICEIQVCSGSFSIKKQKALWYQLTLERRYCNPGRYGRMRLIHLLYANILGISKNAFADEDFGSDSSISYPYPSRMPVFLAAVGILEINRWKLISRERKKILGRLVEAIEGKANEELPHSYHDSSRKIVPLRLAWSSENGSVIRKNISQMLDTNGTWFMLPVIASKEPIENFGYKAGDCPVSEKLGQNMVNIPCNISRYWLDELVNNINNIGFEREYDNYY